METLQGKCGNNAKNNEIRNENKYNVLQFRNEEKNKRFIIPLERIAARAGKAVAKCVKKWEACFNTLRNLAISLDDLKMCIMHRTSSEYHMLNKKFHFA
jgi:hypothetical protein